MAFGLKNSNHISNYASDTNLRDIRDLNELGEAKIQVTIEFLQESLNGRMKQQLEQTCIVN